MAALRYASEELRVTGLLDVVEGRGDGNGNGESAGSIIACEF